MQQILQSQIEIKRLQELNDRLKFEAEFAKGKNDLICIYICIFFCFDYCLFFYFFRTNGNFRKRLSKDE
jgi:hypothetical protein